jgi:hypothetical protein
MPISQKVERTNRLTNFMEELTSDILEDLISKEKKSYSDHAIQDIKALALNRLWPMYTTTVAGKDYLKKTVVQDHVERDIIRELRAAIDIVLANPRR